MVSLLLVVLAFVAVIGLARPTWLVLFYLLASSKFLGFFDMGVFLYNGADVGFFSVNMLVLVLSLVSIKSRRIPRAIFPLSFVLAMLVAWGVSGPYIYGYQSIFLSIIGAKQFLYLSFLLYLMINRTRIDISEVLKYTKYLGVYLSACYIFDSVFGVSPQYYQILNLNSYWYQGYMHAYESVGSGIRVFFPTYISIALFIFCADWLDHRLSSVHFLSVGIFLLIGLLLSGYFALSMTTVTAVVAVFFIYGKKQGVNLKSIVLRASMILLASFLLLSISETMRNTTIDKLNSVILGTNSALVTRDRYNEFRWKAIDERPILGYGFLHKSAPVMSEIGERGSNRFMESLGVIDSGYVDLLTRFGYVGTIFYLLAFSFLLLKIFLNISEVGALGFSMGVFLAQYYLVNVTWSVFSFSHGLIPMSLAIIFVFSSKQKVHDNFRLS
jgi:hypothetical protein